MQGPLRRNCLFSAGTSLFKNGIKPKLSCHVGPKATKTNHTKEIRILQITESCYDIDICGE